MSNLLRSVLYHLSSALTKALFVDRMHIQCRYISCTLRTPPRGILDSSDLHDAFTVLAWVLPSSTLTSLVMALRATVNPGSYKDWLLQEPQLLDGSHNEDYTCSCQRKDCMGKKLQEFLFLPNAVPEVNIKWRLFRNINSARDENLSKQRP